MKILEKIKGLLAESDKVKHIFICMAIMFFASVAAIAVLTDGYILKGESTFRNVVLGLVIGFVVTLIPILWKEYWYDKKQGKGTFDKRDINAGYLGIAVAAIILIVVFLIIAIFT